MSGDPLRRQIDAGYDKVEQFVDSVGSMLGVSTMISTPDEPGATGLSGKMVVSSTVKALPKPATLALGDGVSSADPKPKLFEIKPSVDPKTGTKVWIVTNGVDSAVCKTAELAIDVLAIVRGKVAGT
jgi:hypothetical protein